MSKVIVKESPINGLVVFAITNIAKGEVILAIDDSRVVTSDLPLVAAKGEFDYHCDYLAGGKVVLMPFPERHINHSWERNMFVKTVLGICYVFAWRPTSAGEEITYDYCINGFGDTLWECNCGSAQCRKTIHSDFFHLPFNLQVEYMPILDDWYIGEYREKVEYLLEKEKI